MEKPNRRTILTGALIAGSIPAVAAVATGKANGIFDNRPTLAMIAYPGMFPLDLVGPEAVFSGMGTHKVEIIWKDKNPVKSDSGLAIVPTMTFEEAPKKIDILFVPGGALGTVKCMQDKDVIDFLQSRAKDASLVTSVCTGSLILAAAGLLKGYKATSHWAVREKLGQLGAIYTPGRVIVDRDRITAGGVTSGIDMALTLAAKLTNDTRAKAIELNIEYDPQPPFSTGSPEKAGEELTEMLRKSYSPFYSRLDAALPDIKSKIGL